MERKITRSGTAIDVLSSVDHDLLVPKVYPDPREFRVSLQDISASESKLIRHISQNKASIKVLAPYLKVQQKDLQKGTTQSIKKKIDTSAPPKLKDSKRLYNRFTNVFPDVTGRSEMVSSIHETADVLKSLLKANTVVSYLVNPSNTNELFQVTQNFSASPKVTWQINPASTMTAYAAFKKQHVISDNVLADKRFQDGLGFISSMAKFGLCVPIMTPDRRVLGVYEFSRDAYQEPFEKKDIQIVLAVTGWMGVAMLQNSLYNTMARQNELTDYLLQLTDFNFSDQADKEKIMSTLVVFARDAIGAERCKLYIIDEQSKSGLILDEYDQGFDRNDRLLYKRKSKKKLESEATPLARALLRNEIVNEKNFECDEGKKSLLCVPIVCGRTVVGAIELMDDSSESFDISDEEALREFAIFCSININHKNIHHKVKNSELRNNIFSELLFHHIKPCIHDEEKYMKKVSSTDFDVPEGFFTFMWYPSVDDMPRLTELTIHMFQEVLGESFMTRNNIPKFVVMVQKCYRSNPYHNFLHAFCVTHTMANIIGRHHTVFTRIEVIGLMIAALSHDLDHRGYTNNFIQLTSHYLSTLYESSPLENHHFAVANIIIQQCGMFKDLKQNIYNQLLLEIYELIIATDLSLYFQSRNELMKVADRHSFTFKDHSHRRLVKGMIMTACDLSGQTKPLPVSQKLTEDVYEEFFQQGDAEKAMGLVPLPAMDRDKKHAIVENQINFLSTVVIPCYEIVSRFFNSVTTAFLNSKLLLEQWKDLIEVKKSDNWRPDDSLPKKDESRSSL